MKRIVVTGASGFVGVNLVERLLGEGRDVWALSAEPMPEAARAVLAALPGQLTADVVDVRDRADLRFRISAARPDAVIAGAAITPGASGEAATLLDLVDINVGGAVATLSAAFDAGARRGVYLSSASVYGAAPAVGGALDEVESPPQPLAGYGVSKLCAERMCLRLAATRGVDVVALRVGTVFGPWERETGVRETLSPIFQVMMQARRGEEIVLPRPGVRDFLYAPDVAAAVLACLDGRSAQPVYNIGPGAEWSVADWCARLAQAHGCVWRFAEAGEAPTVDYHGAADRPPLNAARLRADLGFAAAHGLEEAFAHYTAWLSQESAT